MRSGAGEGPRLPLHQTGSGWVHGALGNDGECQSIQNRWGKVASESLGWAGGGSACDNPRSMAQEPIFAGAGNKTSDIDVRLSYKIVELFSEGLYASPNKAVEELVANSFDSGALQVWVALGVLSRC